MNNRGFTGAIAPVRPGEPAKAAWANEVADICGEFAAGRIPAPVLQRIVAAVLTAIGVTPQQVAELIARGVVRPAP